MTQLIRIHALWSDPISSALVMASHAYRATDLRATTLPHTR